ncbi:thiamine pyrophosphate-binding protein [Acetobacterium tundrae]|uniref:Thiamine pyrophosphate-binding protein n=1 Tax=Acetobacterium tundrae TaxID=132932 RepID=A0ABR6WKT3_9FIRM|nr:thiamine pyrophosphate-binding protein [Acetobacterium tundrae]MBC3797054.1 hypothetical protein [Acetobacterium tundrae]
MKVAEYIAKKLIDQHVTDVFGIPGGVILDLIYAFDKCPGINAHLSYHEQAAAFEACGYAQVNHSLGVAYATRGPGFTNLITGIADAYADSLPVLFITAHSGLAVGHEQRFEQEQEMDTVQMVKYITKFASTVECIDQVEAKIDEAISKALTGRKGPVLLDFSTSLWNEDVENDCSQSKSNAKHNVVGTLACESIWKIIEKAQRPVFLLGDGIRQANVCYKLSNYINDIGIPVLTSRGAQDTGRACREYYGYIGSHGIRYSNFIFAKADLVISMGNRLAFPVKSESFQKAIQNKTIIRIECDENELKRAIPNSIVFKEELSNFVQGIKEQSIKTSNYESWLNVCRELKRHLCRTDCNDIVDTVSDIFRKISDETIVVADVGNNEFWLSRAYEISGIKNRILYSKSFGALGCGIGKAIGAYYKTKKPILCVVGDQGLQLNIQELQLMTQEKLPITIFVVNNHSSGMIKDRQKSREKFVHTTLDSGFMTPKFNLIAQGYGIDYLQLTDDVTDKNKILEAVKKPIIIERFFDESIGLQPSLPKGKQMQDMTPEIDRDLFKKLSEL